MKIPEFPCSSGQTGFLNVGTRDLFGSRVFLFFFWFVLILALKWGTLNQPPVWDGSMSVFPAAITLAENNFDIGHLLAQPKYEDGGPNVHSISIVTWITAGVVGVVGDGPALLPVLHLLHFAVAAAAMVGLLRFALLVLSPANAFLCSIAILLHPLVLTQVGFMYLEVPLLVATVYSLLAWSKGRTLPAALWAGIAILIKSAGIIVTGALILATLVAPGKGVSRWRTLALVVVPGFIVSAAILANSDLEYSLAFGPHFLIMGQYLMAVPDLCYMLFLFLVVILLTWRRSLGAEGESRKSELLILALFFSFFGFFSAIPLISATPVLPRYFVQLVPFLLIGLFLTFERRYGGRATVPVVLLVMVFFALNINGRFYGTSSSNSFPLQERSGGYAPLLELHQEGIRVLEDLQTEEAVFYGQPEHYRFTYPMMGYSSGRLPTGHSVRHVSPYKSGRLGDFPDSFYMLYDYPWLGGEIIQSVREQAENDPNWNVEVTPIRVDAVESRLIHVTRIREGMK